MMLLNHEHRVHMIIRRLMLHQTYSAYRIGCSHECEVEPLIHITVSTAPRKTVRPPERLRHHPSDKGRTNRRQQNSPPVLPPRARDPTPAHLETMHHAPLPVLHLMTTANVPVPIVATHLYRWPISGIVARDATDTLDVNGTPPFTPPPCFANS